MTGADRDLRFLDDARFYATSLPRHCESHLASAAGKSTDLLISSGPEAHRLAALTASQYTATAAAEIRTPEFGSVIGNPARYAHSLGTACAR